MGNAFVTKSWSALLFLAWFGTVVFRFMEPASPWVQYAVNYGILVKIIYWLSNVILVLACIGAVTLPSLAKEAGNKLKGETKTFYYMVFRCGYILFLLFLGITGVDWVAFATMAIYLFLAETLIAICKSETAASDETKKQSDATSPHH